MLWRIGAFIAALIGASGCVAVANPSMVQPSNKQTPASLSKPGIDDLYAAWSEAFRRQDVNAILGLMTPDYVLWAPGAAEQNAESLRPRFGAAFTAYDITSAFERVELLVADDLAVDRGWDIQQLQPRAGGAMLVHRQRVMLVLRRCSDGKWRFARGISQLGPPA